MKNKINLWINSISIYIILLLTNDFIIKNRCEQILEELDLKYENKNNQI